MKTIPPELTLAVRSGLSEDLLALLRKYPRNQWADDPRIHGLAEMWLQRHDMFRELSVLVRDLTAELREERLAPARFMPLFQRRMGLLLGELEAHHQIEDHHYFPAFAASAPKLERGFAILDNDHHVIHAAIHDLSEASRALLLALSGEVSGRDGDPMRVADRLGERITAFDRIMLRHLEDEEDLIIPLILERARDDDEFR